MAMDKTLSFDNPKSAYICAHLKTNKENIKNGVFEFKSSEGMISGKEFENLSSYTEALTKKATSEILEGFIKPTPLKSADGLACRYCEFRQLCGIENNEESLIRIAKSSAKDFFKGEKTWQK